MSGFLTYCTPRIAKNLIQLPVDLILLMIFLPAVKFAYEKVRTQFGRKATNT